MKKLRIHKTKTADFLELIMADDDPGGWDRVIFSTSENQETVRRVATAIATAFGITVENS